MTLDNDLDVGQSGPLVAASHAAPLEGSGPVESASVLTFEAVARALNPLLWLEMRATSGTTEINEGTLGAAQNGTISGLTLAQAGLSGPNEALDWNGASGNISVPNAGALNLTTFTFAVLCNPDSAGEGDSGRFFDHTPSSLRFFGFAGSSGVNARIRAIVGAATTLADTFTSYSEVFDGSWRWYIMTYDNGGDRKTRVYRNVTELTYTTQDAAVGEFTNVTSNLVIGNRGLDDVTFDGRKDKVLYFNYILDADQRRLLVASSGIAV